MSARCRTLLPVLALVGLLPHLANAAAAPASGGRQLIETMEQGGIGIVGRVSEIRRLDNHGYEGRIWAERVLGPRASHYETGEAVRLAWEELATGRPPRFAESDRVLIVIERLGTASIWRNRISDPNQLRRTFGIASDGDAFLRDPDLPSLDALHHYLAISPEARDGPAGCRYLASLAQSALPPLALNAAQRLGKMSSLPESLGEPGESSLLAALARSDAEPDLTAALLPVFSRAKTPSLEKALSRRTTARGPPAPARFFEALARVRADGLTSDELEWLAARKEPGYRAVVAHAGGIRDLATLRELSTSDPDAKVRASALVRLVELLGAEALPDALAALADPAPAVRATASRSAGSLGDAAVPSLHSVAYGTYSDCCEGSVEAPRAAIAGLRVAGRGGRKALAQIAADHPDPALRKLAGIALGELSRHEH